VIERKKKKIILKKKKSKKLPKKNTSTKKNKKNKNNKNNNNNNKNNNNNSNKNKNNSNKNKNNMDIDGNDNKTETARITYVSGDITDPQSPDTHKMILQFVNNTGHWPMGGLFKSLSSKWKITQKTYEEIATTKVMGDILIVPVYDNDEVKITVCMLFAHESPSGTGGSGIPPICMDSLSTSISAAGSEAQEIGVTSVHVVKFPHTVEGLDWENFETLLGEIFSKNGIPAYVYTQGSTKRKREETNDELAVPHKKAKTSSGSSIFNGISAIFYGNISQDLIKEFTNCGGTVAEEDDSVPITQITHIVTDKSWRRLFDAVISENSKCKIVTSQWITDTIRQGTLLPTSSYFVRKI